MAQIDYYHLPVLMLNLGKFKTLHCARTILIAANVAVISLTKTNVIVNKKITLLLTKTETETRKFELTITE